MIARMMGLSTMTPAELRRRLDDGSVALFDVNSPASWRAGRIPGARHLDPDRFAADDVAPASGRALVFYCANPYCLKAPRAARRALRLGLADVHVLPAGISGWRDAGLPVEAGD